jgi:hypothetical protein
MKRTLLARTRSERIDTTVLTVAVKRGSAEGAKDWGYEAVKQVQATRPDVTVLGYWSTGERTPQGDPVYAVEVDDAEAEGVSLTPLIDAHIGDVYDEHMVTTAARLVSEDGENAEYDRGVAEMLSDLIDIPHAERSTLLRELRAVQRRPDSLYEAPE